MQLENKIACMYLDITDITAKFDTYSSSLSNTGMKRSLFVLCICRYIKACGGNLKCLYLSSCSFVTDNGVEVICKNCPNLTGKFINLCEDEISCFSEKMHFHWNSWISSLSVFVCLLFLFS